MRERSDSKAYAPWTELLFVADVATGAGPFLAIYLTATRQWMAFAAAT